MDTSNEDRTLTFYGNDPGAAKFGNFINYYSFHSANERIKNLNHNMFPVFDSNTSSILILDIGCNTGELTIEMYRYLQVLYPDINIYVLAIDIDPILIERAKNEIENISFVACNIMTSRGKKILSIYLDKFKRKGFDITFCFSVTMWIHINNGDEKFIEFLNFLKIISKSIIIEPQPWKCYKTAQRRMKRAGTNFELFNSLHITSNVEHIIEEILSDATHEKVFETPSSWNRIIQSYSLRQ